MNEIVYVHEPVMIFFQPPAMRVYLPESALLIFIAGLCGQCNLLSRALLKKLIIMLIHTTII
jgi:hypothetical protein